MILAEKINLVNDDLTVVNAARVSFGKESKEFTLRKDKPKGSDEGLVTYLASHNHWTPFSHVRETYEFNGFKWEEMNETLWAGLVQYKNKKFRHSLFGWVNLYKAGILPEMVGKIIMTNLATRYPNCFKALLPEFGPHDTRPFDRRLVNWVAPEQETDERFIDFTIRETIPIFIARQRFKHMIGFTYNEVSRRYVKDDPEFFETKEWRSCPTGSMKQGSGEDLITELHIDNGSFKHDFHDITDYYYDIINQSKFDYYSFIDNKVAPELARSILPQSMLTSYYVTGSKAAFRRAYEQRIDSHAQKEIQDLAVQWNEIIGFE